MPRPASTTSIGTFTAERMNSVFVKFRRLFACARLSGTYFDRDVLYGRNATAYEKEIIARQRLRDTVPVPVV